MVAGLTPVMPSGALYMMVGIELDKFPHFNTAVDFIEQLMSEESVFILPGEVSIKINVAILINMLIKVCSEIVCMLVQNH